MEKVLKKYTIIPQHLYVNRNADNELKRIIEEMQRPGYVLVARQMGKTNLLFHAKRTLESKNRLFVYVDLSNLFENERDCYRNIINNVIEPNTELFESIETEIEKIRVNNLTPHNEYSRCLRTILKLFKGDIVIILDEIDALKSIDYSDNIFAQIRSNYFSRTNFPEFERLTYVLSGVIEPTELIKDRNKSPFNIGDKIYLDDFTKEEHNDFIKMSGLKISQGVSDEIFNWVNGNPRLTFDICSDLEDCILSNEIVNENLLENLVNKKYLTTYDIAPIDHIRELVKTNKQVRKSVSLINKKQSSELSDEIKRKLYLYGIIDSKFDRETKIKNKIIEQSLSENWIKSIDILSTDIYNYGLEKMDSKEYSEAISSLLEFLENSNPTIFQTEVCNYNIGFAYYNLREYENANDYFSKEFSRELYKLNAFSLLGICKIGIGKVEEGIEVLEKVIESKTNDFAYRNALLNLARNLGRNENERALLLYDLLYKSTFESKDEISESELNQLRTICFYYQAELHHKDFPEKALDKINHALEYSDPSDSIFLIFYKYHLDIIKDESLKVRLINTIIDNKLSFGNQDSHPISFSKDVLYVYLDFVFDISNLTLFEDLLNYSATKLLPTSSKYEIIYQTVLGSTENKLNLLNYLLKFKDSIEENLLIDIYLNLALNQSDDNKKFLETCEKYFNLFIKSNRITADDIYLFAVSAGRYFNQNKFFDVINLCKKIESKFPNIEDEKLKLESAIIYYWFAMAYFSIKDRINAKKYSDKALELISNSNKKSTSILDEKGLQAISGQLHQIKYSSNINQPILNNRKYGRNEKVKVKYLDGREVVKKYKIIEADILAERCRILP